MSSLAGSGDLRDSEELLGILFCGLLFNDRLARLDLEPLLLQPMPKQPLGLVALAGVVTPKTLPPYWQFRHKGITKYTGKEVAGTYGSGGIYCLTSHGACEGGSTGGG